MEVNNSSGDPATPANAWDGFAHAQAAFVRLSSRDAGVNCGAALEDLSQKARAAAAEASSKAPSSCSYMASIGGKAEGEAPVTPPGMEELHPRTHLPMSLYASDPSAGGSGGSNAGGDPGGDQAGAQRASWRSWWRGRGRQAQQGEGLPAQQQQQQQQQQGLSTTRAMSSIPMTGPMPHHQQSAYASKPAAPTSTQQQGPAGPQAASPQSSPQGEGAASGSDPVWVYPSESMFYNAMKRKGWNPEAPDMPMVVAIHNTVNERAWAEVMAWESRHQHACPTGPRLKRFVGKPSELSPKARVLNFIGFAPPFDRHDWVVDRCGQEVRYVIDFYAGVPRPGGPPAAMFMDVRPALDSVGAVWDRVSMQARWVASGQWASL